MILGTSLSQWDDWFVLPFALLSMTNHLNGILGNANPANYRHPITKYATSWDWVYENQYSYNTSGRENLAIYQKWFVDWFFRP